VPGETGVVQANTHSGRDFPPCRVLRTLKTKHLLVVSHGSRRAVKYVFGGGFVVVYLLSFAIACLVAFCLAGSILTSQKRRS